MFDKLIKGFTSGAAEGLTNGISKVIGNFKADPTEKMKLEQELQLVIKENVLKAKEQEIKDKDSARDMYKNDSTLQKVFAITFLIGYIGITGFLLYFLITNSFDNLGAYAAGLISSIFTAMSTKVATICDFLFGGSSPKQEPLKFDKKDSEPKKKLQ